MHQWPENPEEGALIGYGPRLTQLFRQLARQLVKVLRGTKPSDVPVEQPTTVELAINLKTAKGARNNIPDRLTRPRRRGDRIRGRFSRDPQPVLAHSC